MKPNLTTPPSPAPHTPIVYVRDRTVWQYKVLSRDVPLSPSEEELNALGKEGWELTAVLSQGAVTRFYFKRMKD
jgi:hypothetical protein